jgi:hypothetical protein
MGSTRSPFDWFLPPRLSVGSTACGFGRIRSFRRSRIEAYGLVDCLAERAKGPLKGCPCQKLSERPCRHTLTRLIPGDDTPYQEDYLFASQALAGTLDDCFALEPEEWRSFSDHAPIIGTFKL